MVAQLDELTVLVADLVDLARGDEPDAGAEDVRLDMLVEDAVERARRHAPDKVFFTELEPCLVAGVPARLDRAVTNLLDNAAKWSPAGGQIEVRVRDGEVSVRDHGPGHRRDADLPYVFDRFYRAPAARGLPGSGLGLAIVRQVAESHGGSGGRRACQRRRRAHEPEAARDRLAGNSLPGMRLAVISDTHMAAGGRNRLPGPLRGADRRQRPARARGRHHDARGAGRDRGDRAAVRAVTGNMDGWDLRERLPDELTRSSSRARRWRVVHDAGPAAGRLARMRRRFPGADAVVFGHSHIPLHVRDGDFQIFNPGSPTERRRAPLALDGPGERGGRADRVRAGGAVNRG